MYGSRYIRKAVLGIFVEMKVTTFTENCFFVENLGNLESLRGCSVFKVKIISVVCISGEKLSNRDAGLLVLPKFPKI